LRAKLADEATQPAGDGGWVDRGLPPGGAAAPELRGLGHAHGVADPPVAGHDVGGGRGSVLRVRRIVVVIEACFWTSVAIRRSSPDTLGWPKTATTSLVERWIAAILLAKSPVSCIAGGLDLAGDEGGIRALLHRHEPLRWRR
jgi:hypothetical protein